MRKVLPVARRVLGEGNDLMIRMSRTYAMALYDDEDASLDDVREAVTTLEETERIARRTFDVAHPLVENIEGALLDAQDDLRARETPSGSP